MIVVTGGAGFIGSNIVRELVNVRKKDVIVVDDLKNGHQFDNIVDIPIKDYIDKETFIKSNIEYRCEAIIHQGACSSTTEWDGEYMMKNNLEYSKQIFEKCYYQNIPLIYASSAAVYGTPELNVPILEREENERPLNVYGYSKLLFDNYLRQRDFGRKGRFVRGCVGLRYFNVYGPGEHHKGSMASTAFHFNNQLKEDGVCKLFESNEPTIQHGEQLRDFVYVGDIVKVIMWLLDNPWHYGVYNVGSGKAQTFNDVAKAVIDYHGKGEIEYIPFPDHLKGAYQNYTEANLDNLRNIGYSEPFLTVEEGVKRYLTELDRNKQ